MRIGVGERLDRLDRFYLALEWRDWFAWYPFVFINEAGVRTIIWLVWIKIRRRHHISPYGPVPEKGWEYK